VPARARRWQRPACLPASVDHSAKLAGVPVDVSPARGQTRPTRHADQLSRSSGHAASTTSPPSASTAALTRRRRGLLAGRRRELRAEEPVHARRAGERERFDRGGEGGKRVSYQLRSRLPGPRRQRSMGPRPASPPATTRPSTRCRPQAPVMTVTAPDGIPRRRHIHNQRSGGSGPLRRAIYTPQGSPRLVPSALGRDHCQQSERPELRRPARSHVLAGQGSLTRLRRRRGLLS